MKRTLEPELMDDPEQALAYARADFEKENQGFVDRFREYFPEFTEDEVAAQLAEMNLSRLIIDVVDDRHWVVSGIIH